MRAVTACQQAFVVLAGMECRRLSTAGEQRHMPKVQTLLSTHPQERCGWRSTDLSLTRAPLAKAGARIRSLHGAPQAGEAKTMVPSPWKVVPW